MARNSNNWTIDLNNSSNYISNSGISSLSEKKTSIVKPSSIPNLPKQKSTFVSPVSKKPLKSNKHVHCTLQNKGNTCYVNVIIQTLRLMPTFWSDTSSSPSPLALAFRNVVAKMDSNSCIDPSPFLSALEKSLRSSGNPDFADFRIYVQQDVIEVLDHILNEVSVSPFSKRSLSIRSSSEISCDTCYNSLTTDDMALILKLPILADTQTSLNSILASEPLRGDNAAFCHFCGSKQDSELKVSIIEVNTYFIVQFLRFSVADNEWTKNAVPVLCSPYLDVPVRSDDEVTCNRKFALFAGICHSGKKNSGHYTAFVRDEVCGSWMSYNDRAVSKTSLDKLNGVLPYVLFYKAC